MSSTNWRIRPTRPLEEAVSDIARREGRSVSGALLRLVREAVAARGRLGALDPLPAPVDEHEVRRRTITVRSVDPSLRQTIKVMGRNESRTVSNMTRRLIVEALRARGAWPPLEKAHVGVVADDGTLG